MKINVVTSKGKTVVEGDESQLDQDFVTKITDFAETVSAPIKDQARQVAKKRQEDLDSITDEILKSSASKGSRLS